MDTSAKDIDDLSHGLTDDLSHGLIVDLSHGLNEASLSDAAPKSKFCSTCVKALHYGNLPAVDCSADGDDLDREHRFIGAADVSEPFIQKFARAPYEELSKQALPPASPVGHDGPTAQEGAHLEEGKPDEDLVVFHRKRLDSALLKTALKATKRRIQLPSGDGPCFRAFRLGDIEIKIVFPPRRSNFDL